MRIFLERKLIAVVVAIWVLCNIADSGNRLQAQTATSSPYSRYGIGDLNGKGFAQGFAMAGTHIAMQNDSLPMFFINTGNPASYSSLRLTTVDLGLNYSRLQLQNSTAKSVSHSAALGYISIAFPFKKWWGGSIGLIPYSSVGYKVSDQQSITNVGTVDFLYEGTGGVNQAYFGNGIKPLYGLPRMFTQSKKYKELTSKRKPDLTTKTPEEYTADIRKATAIYKRKKSWQALSIGFNASYLFGSIENSGRTIFPGSTLAFNTKTATIKRINDFYLDYGVQHAFVIDSIKGRVLKEKVKIMWGATFATQSNLSAKIDSLSYTYFNSSSGYEVVKDTVVNVQDVNGEITFPLSFGFGLAFKKGDRWLVAADYAIQNWSSYKAFNQTQGLKNSMRVALGVQFVPNAKATGLNNYHKRVLYRAGVRYNQSAIELKSTPLVEYAVSAGVGLPVGRNFLLQNFSMVNIGVEFGQRGTISNGLIKEQFFRATIGFTMNDRWFVKPKFD
jgi:hypothetical protein